MKTIFTIGHSSKSLTEFLEKLQENNIDMLVDVRTFPRSRFYPHFNEKLLSQALLNENITYLFKGNNLGGKGENINYDEAIDELVHKATRVLFCLLALQGMRQIEIIRLNIEDISLVHKKAFVQGKGSDDKESIYLLLLSFMI